MTILSAQFQSAALSFAEYDTDSEQLEITFTSGKSYTFERVPQNIFEALRDAGSPGSYFHQNIKGRY
jgi:KTSC domain